MRRIAIILPLLAAGLLAGCGGSSGNPAVQVSGRFGQAPSVTIPAAQPGGALQVKTLIHGSGPALGRADYFAGNYVVYIWNGTTHRLGQSSYIQHQPGLFGGQLLPGLEKGLIGQKMGSRVLIVIPPKDGFGTAGNRPAHIKGTDTLVFVVDLLQKFAPNASATGQAQPASGKGLPTVTATPGAAPVIKMPGGNPPTTLVTKTLIKGTGPAVASGDFVVAQYVGAIWKTGTVFDASWRRNQPFTFTLAPSGMIAGWIKGLTGQTVGSRVLLVIPPKDGYGAAGAPQAGIKGTDTLVFVVDILGAFKG